MGEVEDTEDDEDDGNGVDPEDSVSLAFTTDSACYNNVLPLSRLNHRADENTQDDPDSYWLFTSYIIISESFQHLESPVRIMLGNLVRTTELIAKIFCLAPRRKRKEWAATLRGHWLESMGEEAGNIDT